MNIRSALVLMAAIKAGAYCYRDQKYYKGSPNGNPIFFPKRKKLKGWQKAGRK